MNCSTGGREGEQEVTEEEVTREGGTGHEGDAGTGHEGDAGTGHKGDAGTGHEGDTGTGHEGDAGTIKKRSTVQLSNKLIFALD